MLAIGCSLQADDGSSDGLGGQPAGTGGGGGQEVDDAPGGGTVGEMMLDAPGGGPLGPRAECAMDPQVVALPAEQALNLAPGQYFDAILRATKRGPKSPLTVKTLLPYLENQEGMLGAPASIALAPSAQEPKHYVLTSEGRFQSELDEKDRTLHMLLIIDLSPSNQSVKPTRDRVLDEIAIAVDAQVVAGKAAKFSLIGFSADAAILVDPGASGTAFNRLETARAALSPSEGENFNAALELADGLTKDGETTHVLLLTDGGFLATEEVRLKAEELATNPDRPTRISVAQLSNTAQLATGQAPELRLSLLSGIANPGRGMSLFLNETALIPFDTWFNRLASSGATFNVQMPPGLVIDPEDLAEGTAEPELLNPRMAVSLRVGVTDDCNLGGQVGTTGGSLAIGLVGMPDASVELFSPNGDGLTISTDDGLGDRNLAEARLEQLVAGESCPADAAEYVACNLVDGGELKTHHCLMARTINQLIDGACGDVQ